MPLNAAFAKYCAVQTGEAQVTAADAGGAVIRPLAEARAAVAASVLSRVRVITEKSWTQRCTWPASSWPTPCDASSLCAADAPGS
ncbi:hypothetical protein OQI_13015 [Streptomyces pharetrae CZA14]|uniref:Uncharacterized protein n=1 Tax=Streptomyces pharetrae CZA14 TaxID=1144883 RepID=A0ABX3YKN3_9ACTN|nr:hypothetical protein OQI_13015 [Streptomyces pharetrae CZA14]